MTLSPAYRVCIEKLERVLSARVASRSLHAAMDRAGITRQAATADELEPILKDSVFKQLQIAMPPDEARAYVKKMMTAMEEVESASDASADDEATAASDASTADDSSAPDHDEGSTSDRGDSSPADAATAAPSIDPAEYERLREEARPFNLYFTWPEVRRLRAVLARIEAVAEGNDDGDAQTLVAEAERSLANVRQTLEDRLVLQAQELAKLEEAYEEVADLGGPKTRRLDNMIKRVRDAQDDRQLADAELERGTAIARELRKAIASSVYEEDSSTADSDLEARIKALDVDAELAELDRHVRDRAVLLEYRTDLADRVDEARTQIASGLTLGDDLPALRATLDQERTRQISEVRQELGDLETKLNENADAWDANLKREHAVLVDIVGDDGLPSLADLVRFREQVELSLEQLHSADERAEAATAEASARLDLQGDLLERAQQELLRYEDHAEDPGVDRLREAVEALRAVQAEERVDAEAEAAVRRASEALAGSGRDGDDPASRSRAQLTALLNRLAGLPAAIDPTGEAELREDLETKLDTPLDDDQLASYAAMVSDAVDAAYERARQTLDRLSRHAGTWNLSDVLDAVRDANERLEDGGVPKLGELERRLNEAIEAARTAQLARLHELERAAERLIDIDEEREEALHASLAKARERLGEGTPAGELDDIARIVNDLEEVLERRMGDVLPRLDAALTTLETVARLNSDEVATVRRILAHLDSQRDAFARVSPTLRARMERSLQEAEDLLAELVEEEEATRAIADQLMSGSMFDSLLSGFGDRSTAADPSTGTANGNGAATRADADAWIATQVGRSDVVAAGLMLEHGDHGRGTGFPDDSDPSWADRSRDVVQRLGDLGRTLALGAPQLATFEYDDGCLLLGHDAAGTALLASREPGTLGLLVQEMREDGWRQAAASLHVSSAGSDETAVDADADADGSSSPG